MFQKHNLLTSSFLLIVFVITMLGVPPSADAQEVHAFFIIMNNDKDSSFNYSTNQNWWNVEEMLRPLNISPEIWQASKRPFQPIDIANWVQYLEVQSEDTVFVYYSGHGFMENEKHYLALDGQNKAFSLLRNDLAKAVSEKRCRLKMLITDTCSNYIKTGGSDESIRIEGSSTTPPSSKKAIIRNLFFGHRGFLDITAASPNQYALGNVEAGGYFTASLINSVNEKARKALGGESVSWKEVFESTRQKTQKLFSAITFTGKLKRMLDAKGQTTQTPFQHALPTPIKADVLPGTTEIQTIATLDITSTPSGATVYVDGTRVGTTPLRGHEVDTGVRRKKQVEVGLELTGYRSKLVQLTLEGGKSKPWNAQLEKMQQTRRPVTSEMVLIPAGKFRMGTDQLIGNESKPIHTVYLDAFYINKYEVTVGEYKQFLLDSGHPRPLHSGLSEYSPTDDHPIVGISWHDAMAYAQWAGKRLPTEAEWEKAARGGLMDMRYSWGNETIDSSKANYGNIHDGTVPAGNYPPNAFGLYDMTGNVMEWCLDPWDGNFYAKSPAENPFAGQKSQDATIADYKTVRGLRVVRGGSWSQKVPATFWVSGRFKYDAMAKGLMSIGFRCAKDAQP